MFRGVQVSLAVHCQIQLGLNSLNSHHSKTHRDEVKQSVSAVLVFGAINGSICLQLQVVALSAVEFGDYPLKLRLWSPSAPLLGTKEFDPGKDV